MRERAAFAHVYTIVVAVMAAPPGLRADEAVAAPTEPRSAETAPLEKQTTAPLFLKNTRIYLGRTVPVDAKDGAAPSPELDLELKPEDLRWLMAHVPYNPDDAEPGTVEVTGQFDDTGPDIPANPFASMFWALKNPKQAWRLFTPVQ